MSRSGVSECQHGQGQMPMCQNAFRSLSFQVDVRIGDLAKSLSVMLKSFFFFLVELCNFSLQRLGVYLGLLPNIFIHFILQESL